MSANILSVRSGSSRVDSRHYARPARMRSIAVLQAVSPDSTAGGQKEQRIIDTLDSALNQHGAGGANAVDEPAGRCRRGANAPPDKGTWPADIAFERRCPLRVRPACRDHGYRPQSGPV